MSRLALQDQVMRDAEWMGPFTRWSSSFALSGPRLIPHYLRRLPLKLASRVMRFYVMKNARS